MGSRARPRACVLKADGTNCEIETAFALELAGADARIVPVNALRWGDDRLADYEILALPGGFSYGDDVAAGKVLAVELISRLADDIAEFAGAGRPVLGICNGFQVLVRTGILPFGDLGHQSVTLAQNDSNRYECRWVRLSRHGSADIVAELPDRLELPVAHAEGRFHADDATLERIEREGLVALRYVDEQGRATARYPANPNGSRNAIAGITDPKGRILGLMPHPERFVAPFHHPDWRRRDDVSAAHGRAFFERLVALA